LSPLTMERLIYYTTIGDQPLTRPGPDFWSPSSRAEAAKLLNYVAATAERALPDLCVQVQHLDANRILLAFSDKNYVSWHFTVCVNVRTKACAVDDHFVFQDVEGDNVHFQTMCGIEPLGFDIQLLSLHCIGVNMKSPNGDRFELHLRLPIRLDAALFVAPRSMRAAGAKRKLK
jgi:hypothetical protein